mmetsp:Transcript_61116/g.121054  ORF Transcript_61116/g.121054 Transcript_61116/m.121054 type:complete len:201 (-) Transcript_61116:837-1439(-)
MSLREPQYLQHLRELREPQHLQQGHLQQGSRKAHTDALCQSMADKVRIPHNLIPPPCGTLCTPCAWAQLWVVSGSCHACCNSEMVFAACLHCLLLLPSLELYLAGNVPTPVVPQSCRKLVVRQSCHKPVVRQSCHRPCTCPNSVSMAGRKTFLHNWSQSARRTPCTLAPVARPSSVGHSCRAGNNILVVHPVFAGLVLQD